MLADGACVPARVSSLGSVFDYLALSLRRQGVALAAPLSVVATGCYDIYFFSPFALTFNFLKGYCSDEQTRFLWHTGHMLFLRLFSILTILEYEKCLKVLDSICACVFERYF